MREERERVRLKFLTEDVHLLRCVHSSIRRSSFARSASRVSRWVLILWAATTDGAASTPSIFATRLCRAQPNRTTTHIVKIQEVHNLRLLISLDMTPVRRSV